jgi:hypothetical protein
MLGADGSRLNPSYPGGRDQEDCGSKPTNSSARPNPEKLFTKIGPVEWLKVKTLSSSPSTTKTKTKNPHKFNGESKTS